MKKSLLIAAAGLFFGMSANAQEFLNETFTGSFNGWVENQEGTSPRTWIAANLAGNNIGEDQLTTGLSGSVFCLGHNNGAEHDCNATLTSPAIDITGATSPLMLTFEHIFSPYDGALTGTAYVSTDGENWISVYETTEEFGPGATSIDVTEHLSGSQTAYIRFRQQSGRDNYWVIDDVVLAVPVDYDVAVAGLELDETITSATSTDGSFTLTNKGLVEVNSVELSVSANGGTPTVSTVSGLTLAPGASTTVNLAAPFSPGAFGGFDVTVEATLVNGEVDGNPANNNDVAGVVFFDANNTVQREPLYEVFTSSTCAPCTPGNVNFHNVIDDEDHATFNYIKYQQDFPGAGDPYVTDEAVARRSYYGINSIPRMEIDGGWDQNAASFNQGLHDAAKANPTFVEIEATATGDVEGQGVSYDVTVTPTISMPEGMVNVYVAVIEKYTDKNVGTNGETEFLHVMKKMIGGADGEPMAAWTAGQPITISGSYVFPGNYRLPAGAANAIDIETENTVEEFSDLAIITWVTHEGTKSILQSEMAGATNSVFELAAVQVEELSVYPNPANEIMNVSFDLKGNASFEIQLTDLTGRVVDTRGSAVKAGKVQSEFNVASLANGTYIVNVLDNEKVVASTKAIVKH